MTETSTEPSPIVIEEDNATEIFQEQGEKKFITSPTDIEVHQKVELQDADVSEEHQNAFKEICKEFKDIFSVDSSDIGKLLWLKWKSILVIVHQSLKNPILFL